MSETLANAIQNIRVLVRQARTLKVGDLPMDKVAGILDHLDRIDWLCLEIKAHATQVPLNGIRHDLELPKSSASPTAPVENNYPERRQVHMEQHTGHLTRIGENPQGEAELRERQD